MSTKEATQTTPAVTCERVLDGTAVVTVNGNQRTISQEVYGDTYKLRQVLRVDSDTAIAVQHAIARKFDAEPPDQLQALRETFKSHLYLPDAAIVDVTAAVAVANRMNGDALWLGVIAPPGSGKTETIASLNGLPEVHPISTLTKNTLLSGKPGRRNSLLFRMQDDSETLLALKEFTTLLLKRADERDEIIAQMREIYDGKLTKEVGNQEETIMWEGRLGFIFGVTPVIDNYRSVMALVGERFLYLRLPEVDRVLIAQRALDGQGNEEAMRRELQRAMTEFVESVDIHEVEMPQEHKMQLIHMANVTSWGRTGVMRDEYRLEMQAAPSPEVPTRIVKQLASLYKALVLMGHEDAMTLTARVAGDSMPPDRRIALKYLHENPGSSTGDIAQAMRLQGRTALRRLHDLQVLGWIRSDLSDEVPTDGEPPDRTYYWWLTDAGKQAFEGVAPAFVAS